MRAADVRAANIRFATARIELRRDRRRRCAGTRRACAFPARSTSRMRWARSPSRANWRFRLRASPQALAELSRRAPALRRILATQPRMTVVDDYAHHPTAVRATIAAARRYHRGPAHRCVSAAPLYAHGVSGARFRGIAARRRLVFLAPGLRCVRTPIRRRERTLHRRAAARTGAQRAVRARGRRSAGRHSRRRAPEGALVLMLGAGNIPRSRVAAGRSACRKPQRARDMTTMQPHDAL